MAKNTRVIKKYPNRRLYDTEQSRYITLVDLQELVMSGEDFEVVDANTGKDITRTILLQIISEQESGGQPLFTTDILLRIIRFYGASVQDAFSTYLEQSLSLFEQQQQAFHEQLKEAAQHNPVTTLSEMTQHNLEIWQQIQDQFFASAGLKTSKKPQD